MDTREIPRAPLDAVYFDPLRWCVFCLLHHVSVLAQRASSVPATFSRSSGAVARLAPFSQLCHLSWLHLHQDTASSCLSTPVRCIYALLTHVRRPA